MHTERAKSRKKRYGKDGVCIFFTIHFLSRPKIFLKMFHIYSEYYYLHGNVGGGLKLADDLMSRSGATRYCEANSLLTASGSSANICILMNGSFPFCVSICHGLGRVNKSETLPCDKPKIHSPNSLWLMEFCESASLTCVRRVIGIISTRVVLALFLSLKVSFPPRDFCSYWAIFEKT